MSFFDRHPRMRWGAPVLALALVTGGSLASSVTASADPTLPPKTASELLADVQQARVDGLSGTVEQRADLGLPDLSLAGMAGGGHGQSARPESALSGTHTWRVWSAGPTKSRVALLGDRGETHFIRNGQDVWLWSSPDQKATHYQLPQDAHPGATPGAKSGLTPGAGPHRPDATGADAMPRTPQEAADQALAMLDPSTEVSAPGTVSVAGRDAYELRLDPRDDTTLVKAVTIAVDAQTKVPLRVQVLSTKLDTPALEVGFTDVDFAVPGDDNFAFTPPAGAQVEQGQLGSGATSDGGSGTKPALPHGRTAGPGSGAAGSDAAQAAKPQVIGSGWGAVLIGRAGAPGTPGGFGATTGDAPDGSSATDGSGGQGMDAAAQLLAQLPTVPESAGVNGRVLEGTLFTVVITDDGRIAGGAVGPEKVYAALAAR